MQHFLQPIFEEWFRQHPDHMYIFLGAIGVVLGVCVLIIIFVPKKKEDHPILNAWKEGLQENIRAQMEKQRKRKEEKK
ncbi:hypothetical protein QUF70_11270 [Desulfobacterales bacterium HSG17]|nr:hypothetical protein [Desulfobacterales bacterium HSG17]